MLKTLKLLVRPRDAQASLKRSKEEMLHELFLLQDAGPLDAPSASRAIPSAIGPQQPPTHAVAGHDCKSVDKCRRLTTDVLPAWPVAGDANYRSDVEELIILLTRD